MNRILLSLSIFLFGINAFCQTGQLSISRIDQMPDLPSPFVIRDWKLVALAYDSLIFNTGKTGQYLPLLRIGTAGQYNYSNNTPIFLDSYVGAANHPNDAEAINILPAIIGASLVGIDKSNQEGKNWVGMTKDFFNLKNGQNVYLNNYSANSGSDWWYDVMPNVFFYQLQSIYQDTSSIIQSQFISIADQWLSCVKKLGGSTTPWSLPNMNYRAFNLATGFPLATGVPEPEAAGSIAWILYNAYIHTGNKEYFAGAQLAMDFLTGFSTDPSYEIQLPYGTLAAARMNAVEGTNYPLQKLLDWCFDHHSPLRGWGSIVGNWGAYDVSGLIGEANDAGNDYAFIMNGFQHVSALAPLPKYDKRYAKPIAKWILNLANASRLFYRNGLPQSQQDSYSWDSIYDPSACIPHESMKQTASGKTPFATGDAIGGGWAATNLSLYSGSSVGYLAAVLSKTNVPEILQIDLNKTDFYGENKLPSYLYFNPTASIAQVNLILPPGKYGIYDAITESILSASDSGTYQLSIPAGEVRLIRLYAAGLSPQSINGKLFAGTDILDYHYQYDYTLTLRVKALSSDQNPVIVYSNFNAYCEASNVTPGDSVKFEWFLNDSLMPALNQSVANFTAPGIAGTIKIKCKISSNGQMAEDSLNLQLVKRIPAAPVVNGIQSSLPFTPISGENNFIANVQAAPGDTLVYRWSVSAGNLTDTSGSSVVWTAPAVASIATISLKVTNQEMLSTTVTAGALVKDTNLAFQTPLIWYPFDKDTKNAIADQYHAIASGASKTDDPRGASSLAYRFTGGTNIIYTANVPVLNFSEAVSLSCWVKCESLGSERFIISHGSWQQRYKLSIIPTGYLRWTVKTDSGVCDLDGSAPISLNKYYHVTALYTGYSMELYLDGKLDAFKAFSGSILASTKPLTLGREDDVETQYNLLGSIDEVKIWDREIPATQIAGLKSEWLTPLNIKKSELDMQVYPNPAHDYFRIEANETSPINRVYLYSIDGKIFRDYTSHIIGNTVNLYLNHPSAGLYLVQIYLEDGRRLNKKILFN